METLLRRLLGLYFVITSLEFVPSALAYLAVENTFGPWWILPFVPIAQAAIFLVAGLFLLRRPAADTVPLGPGVVFPPLDSLLQLMGVYFIVVGAQSIVEPGVNMLFLSEAWVARAGHFSSAIVWLAGGYVLVTRPQAVLGLLTRHKAA